MSKSIGQFLYSLRWAIIFVLASRYVIPTGFWIAASTVVLLTSTAYRYRTAIIQLSPFVFVFSLSVPGQYFSVASEIYGFKPYVGVLISLAAFLSFCVTLHLFDKFITSYKIISLSLFLGAWFYLCDNIHGGIFKFFTIAYVFFVQAGFWYFILSSGEKNILNSGVFFTRFNLSHLISKIPIPPQLLLECETKDYESFQASQKKAVISLLVVVLVRFLYTITIQAFYRNKNPFEELFVFSYVDPYYNGLLNKLISEFSAFGFFSHWLAIYILAVLVIVATLTFIGIAVAYYQCIGFDIPHIVKPFREARFYHEYFGSIYRYFNKALVTIFFRRFYGQLKFVRKRHRVPAAVFLTLFVGGWFFSLQKDIFKLRVNYRTEFFHSLNGIFYFFVLGCMSSISVYLQTRYRSQRRRPERLPLHSFILRFFGFFLIFGLLISLRWLINYTGFSFEQIKDLL